MSNLNLYTSNRLENLAEALAGNVRRPLRSPLASETILVQSQGMARWLKLQLARQHGICSNCRFPFPRAFSHEIFRLVLGSLPAVEISTPELLRWRVMKSLPAFQNDAGFEAVRHYLGGQPDERKLYQLTDRIANVFDQYLVFRPELIREWEGGSDDHWQAVLWRAVSESFREQHPAALQARLIERLESGAAIGGLPERVAIFGVSALPPFYLRIFSALSRQVEISLYLLQPCEAFWGYISSFREQEKMLQRAGKGAADAGQLHLERGNQLLASLGQLGRDFLLLLQESGDWQESEPSRFEAPAADTILSHIQTDILRLEDFPAEKQIISVADDSLQVHSCHSPLRELEVLHDHLLDWFARDPELAPRDILVMIPDIELYAPYIQAVFGVPEQESQRIPFSVADRTARTQGRLTEAFVYLLQLADSRLGASQVLTLLEAAPVRRKFSLTEDDLEPVRHWIDDVRIRWGRDEQQRAGLGLPAWPENTWRHGLDRLLLGYALKGTQDELFQNILPYDDLEGQTAEIFGRFAEFVERLFAALDSFKTSRPLDGWADTLRATLESLFAIGEDEVEERRVLETCFGNLADAVRRAGFDQPVGLGVVQEQLQRDLSQDYFGAGYLTGGVTFCALKPMRSIPAKVICLLGMNDRAFPRTSPQLSFDLMAQKRRLGDRSSREDDRYLFLETLISARDRLYLSYVGQSIRDNSEAPPSVLVSELLDYVEQRFELPGKNIIPDHVLTQHRLQAFSPAYFQGGKLFSYSQENLKASQSTLAQMQPGRPQMTPSPRPSGERVGVRGFEFETSQKNNASSPRPSPPSGEEREKTPAASGEFHRRSPGVLLSAPLPEPEPEWRRVTLDAIAKFFSNPARFFAEKRLGLRLPDEAETLEEREVFSLGGLDRYQLREAMLEQKLRGGRLKNSIALARAAGTLPAGVAGDAFFAQQRREAEIFYRRLQPFRPEEILPPEPFEISIGAFRVTGSFTRLTPDGQLFYRPGRIRAKDLLCAWLEHLLCQASGKPGNMTLVGEDRIQQLLPVENSQSVLADLLEQYWSGLRQPLKFFPESSFAFAEREMELSRNPDGRKKSTPIECALAKWRGNDFSDIAGECADKHFALFFHDDSALDGEFEAVAQTIFAPVLGHLTEVEG